MAYHGYRITYSLRWNGPKSSYIYQRFFRALYGYKQIVSKSNGRRYVYYRPGVLTNHPYIRVGKTAVVVPASALQPLMSFLKTGQNPAHRFTFTGQWPDIVKYSMEETSVADEAAAEAVVAALSRVSLNMVSGNVAAINLLKSINALSPDELYSLYYAIKPIIASDWFPAIRSEYPELYADVQALLTTL